MANCYLWNLCIQFFACLLNDPIQQWCIIPNARNVIVQGKMVYAYRESGTLTCVIERTGANWYTPNCSLFKMINSITH
ncbi:hypothetical protein BLOT_015335 [Blomia tropicalis]|nr:hypothetical protein BLOT_015335 [Blomia tropicalis]